MARRIVWLRRSGIATDGLRDGGSASATIGDAHDAPGFTGRATLGLAFGIGACYRSRALALEAHAEDYHYTAVFTYRPQHLE
jgi:hypothetical protein